MKIDQKYNHNFEHKYITTHKKILDEIEEIINTSNLSFGLNSPVEINKHISFKFNKAGWADKVRVGSSNLTISFLKSKVGVCFQIGNVARTYADILKLMQLYHKKIINFAIIIVPNKLESKKMGTNYAQFDRLQKELSHFKEIINIPILLIGLSN